MHQKVQQKVRNNYVALFIKLFVFNDTHREKLLNQQFSRRICKNRILVASDYLFTQPIKVS